jgi:hypothetical protein
MCRNLYVLQPICAATYMCRNLNLPQPAATYMSSCNLNLPETKCAATTCFNLNVPQLKPAVAGLGCGALRIWIPKFFSVASSCAVGHCVLAHNPPPHSWNRAISFLLKSLTTFSNSFEEKLQSGKWTKKEESLRNTRIHGAVVPNN